MSVRLIADVLEKVHDLTSGQKLLLICLANYANDKGECWPSISSLAAQADVSTRHVSGMLHELAKLGYLTIREHSGKSNSYTLQVPEPTNHSSGDPRTTVHPPTNHSSGVPTNHSSSKPSYRTVIEPSSEPSEKARAKRATQIPDDFTVSDGLYEWAWSHLEIQRTEADRETEKFCDYHRAKGSTMKDWTAAWRNWMRNSVTFGRGKQVNGRASPQMTNAELSRQAIRRAAGKQPEPIGPVYETTGRIHDEREDSRSV